MPREWIVERRPPSPDQERAAERRVKTAADQAQKRRTAIVLDGVARDACLVTTSEVWAAGFRAGGLNALTALIDARGIDLRTLELATVTSNLAALVGNPPTV